MTNKRCFEAVILLTAGMLLASAWGADTPAQTAVKKGPAWAGGLTPLPQETVVKVGMKQVVSDQRRGNHFSHPERMPADFDGFSGAVRFSLNDGPR
jgi:hypothetical protein